MNVRLQIWPARFADEIRAIVATDSPAYLDIAVAWARKSGVDTLLPLLNGVPLRHVVVGTEMKRTSVEALRKLRGVATTLRYYKDVRHFFHPKVYRFGSDTGSDVLAVGSCNLTKQGLLYNAEASLIVRVPHDDPSVSTLFPDADQALLDLRGPAAATLLTTDREIDELHARGHISTEAELNNWRSTDVRRQLAMLLEEPVLPPPLRMVEGDGTIVSGARFYLQTLPPGELNHLHGGGGTLEFDVRAGVRDIQPLFWRWPEAYAPVVHRDTPRDEWEASALIVSARTGPDGIRCKLRIWDRPERPDGVDFREFRVTPIPQQAFRDATPEGFDEDALLVFERAEEWTDLDFIVRLVRREDPGFDVLDPHATLLRPQARFRQGYGP